MLLITFFAAGQEQEEPLPGTLADGIYRIKSKTNNKFLSAAAWSSWQVTEMNKNKAHDQKWVFKHLGNDVYSIILLENGFHLEVPNADTGSGALVAVKYGQPVSDNERWKLHKIGASYYISPKHDPTKTLDIRIKDDRVQIKSLELGAIQQHWQIESVSPEDSIDQQLVLDGSYKISPKINTNFIAATEWSKWNAIEVGEADTNDQKWDFKHLGSNIYTITLLENGRRLEVPYASTANGTVVTTTDFVGEEKNIQWKIYAIDGAYYFSPVHDLTKGMDIRPGDDRIQIWEFNRQGVNQQWDIIPTGSLLSTTDLGYNQESSLRIAPNPARNSITIFDTISNTQALEVLTITDTSGRIVMRHKNSLQKTTETLDISTLASGIYILRTLGHPNSGLRFVKN